MTTKTDKSFSAVQENIRALDANQQTKRWMNTRPQLCWKCQQDKPPKGGSFKFFGSVRRFICVDCVLTKQVALAKERGEMK